MRPPLVNRANGPPPLLKIFKSNSYIWRADAWRLTEIKKF